MSVLPAKTNISASFQNQSQMPVQVKPVFLPESKAIFSQNRMMAEVVFGKSTQNCRGAGICKVMPYKGRRTAENTSDDCSVAIGWIAIEAGAVVFRFSKSGICPKLAAYHFRRQQFRVFEPYRFSRGLSALLGEEAGIVIAPGKYPVEREGFYYKIVFSAG